MLARKRIDYFPRSVVEVWGELDVHSDKPLIADSHILIYYPVAFYFFVNKERQSLAGDIKRGLEQAMTDNSFDQLFDSHYGDALARAKIDQRRIYVLNNSFLPKMTPLERSAHISRCRQWTKAVPMRLRP